MAPINHSFEQRLITASAAFWLSAIGANIPQITSNNRQ